MAVSEVKICNSALIKVGSTTITSLTEDSKPARACNEQYAKLRDEVLSAHPWNFAISRKSLGQTSNTPIWEFDYEYQIPSDVLRILKIDSTLDWQVEVNAVSGAKVIVTDDPEMNIKYIKRVTDTTLFTPYFDEVLATRVAADISYYMTQSTSLMESLMKAYQVMLAQARSFDAQEGTPPEVEADDWLNSRF